MKLRSITVHGWNNRLRRSIFHEAHVNDRGLRAVRNKIRIIQVGFLMNSQYFSFNK